MASIMDRVGWLIAVSALIAGCALKENVITQSVDFNSAVAKTNNQMILLNVLRSMDRSPTHFTRVSGARGSMSYQATTGGLVIPFGRGTDDPFQITPSGSVSYNPTFDLQVMNSKEFYSGFLKPISPQLMGYYLDQGWPKELIFALMIRKIEGNIQVESNCKSDSDGERGGQEFVNYILGDKCQFKRFASILNNAELHKVIVRRCIGDVMTTVGPEELFKLSRYFEQEYKLLPVEAVDGSGDAHEPKIRMMEKRCFKEGCGVCLGKIEERYELKVGSKTSLQIIDDDGDNNSVGRGGGKVYLRSPEAIIYYLGEVTRAQQEKGTYLCLGGDVTNNGLRICTADSGEKLFDLRRVEKGKDYRLTVLYRGFEYGIEPIECPLKSSKCGGGLAGSGRSFSTLTVLSQLIGIYQESVGMPVTPAVQVVQ